LPSATRTEYKRKNMNNTNITRQNIPSNPVIVIAGPTASGKTAFSISLAKHINGEIISADSAQIYRDLSIITARVSPEEMGGIPHHLTGFLGIEDDFSLAQYQEAAYKCIMEILKRGKVPILTGGTGLYIKAVIEDYQFPDAPPDPVFREKLKNRAAVEGRESIYNQLEAKDPVAASRIHPNNLQRVIRALEVIEQTGKLFSFFYRKGVEHPLGITPFCYCLNYPREMLYERINSRVDKMIEEGAMQEIEKLVFAGRKERLEKLKILGCREIIYILEGKCSVREGITLLKRNTRKYAKRQLTWSRSQLNYHWITRGGKEGTAKIMPSN